MTMLVFAVRKFKWRGHNESSMDCMIIYNINYAGFKLILEKVHKKIDSTPTTITVTVNLWNQVQILYQPESAGFVEPGLLTMDTLTPRAGTCFACRAC